jgi:hypothetical protein
MDRYYLHCSERYHLFFIRGPIHYCQPSNHLLEWFERASVRRIQQMYEEGQRCSTKGALRIAILGINQLVQIIRKSCSDSNVSCILGLLSMQKDWFKCQT